MNTDDDLADLVDSFPTLMSLNPFLGLAENAHWYRSLGELPTKNQEKLAHEYALALGFPDASPAFIPDWSEAADSFESLDVNSTAWEAEEQLRSALTLDLIDMVGEDVAELLLTHISQKIAPVLENAALEAAEYLRIDDESFLRAAMGAGVQATHFGAMVVMSGGDMDHAFSKRFALFEAGRWPLGIIGNSFLIF